MIYEVGVIGLGEIGGTTIRAMKASKVNDNLYGVDVKDSALELLAKEGYNVGKEFPHPMDVYTISVLTSEQVEEVIPQHIKYDKNPLVVIESTIRPGTAEKVMKENPNLNLVVFPHRYFPDDPKYHVFNLTRVMGSKNQEIEERAIQFYERYIKRNLINCTDIKTAELCKPLENCVRYVQIAMAEDIYMMCEEKGYDFNKVREAMNTKWNINVLEARDGIGRHCLPKDIQIINNAFGNNRLFNMAELTDKIYKRRRTRDED